MAITFIQQQKKQKYLIAIFAVVIVITVFVLWQGFFKTKPLISLTPEVVIIPPREVRVDFQLLEGEDLRILQFFEGISPLEGPRGRENPFKPF